MNNKPAEYINLFNDSINKLFHEALGLSVKNPAFAYFFSKTIINQKNAERKRRRYEKEGLHVPPIIIASITKKCNLACKGCYMKEHEKNSCCSGIYSKEKYQELEMEKINDIIHQAHDLGVSIILLAGGEPLIHTEILSISASYPEIIFPLFTNGLLLDQDKINLLKSSRNIIPIISMEGNCEETDNRRGAGVYEHIMPVLDNLKNENMFFGVSLTATSSNFNTITSENFINNMINTGSKLFIFVEYVPIDDATGALALTYEQRASLKMKMNELQSIHPGLFIAFPGDEELYGGCLAAGRGFIHINADGNLEPCPFAPFSDVNLNTCSLKDALKSTFLEQIRSNHSQLTETSGGCALWQKREWVQSILAKKL
jgi:Predicted Fe-S oxidoreductases